MGIFEGFRLAFEALLANKLRSVLTLIGMVIGVAAVVAMVSLGAGAEKSVTDEFRTLGNDLIFVQPDYDSEKPPAQLDRVDLQAIGAGATAFADQTPFNNAPAELRQGAKRLAVTIAGTEESFLTVQNLAIACGRFFTAREAALGARVCVVGPRIRDELAGGCDITGESVRLNGERFTIVGVMAEKAERSMVQDGLTGDSMVYMPMKVFQHLTGAELIPVLIGRPVRPDRLHDAVGQVSEILIRLHGRENGFMVSSTEDILASVNRVIGIFTVVLGCLGGISLLVGGIGVMNVMLVAVTERTREIGTRRAVGAKRRHIMLQFLVESVTLAGCGGVAGVVCGVLMAVLVGAATPINTAITGGAMLTAFGCILGIGVLFGIYPAWRAAHLDPIEALRYE